MTEKKTYLRLGQPLPKKILLEGQKGQYFKYYTLARPSDKTFSTEGPGEDLPPQGGSACWYWSPWDLPSLEMSSIHPTHGGSKMT